MKLPKIVFSTLLAVAALVSGVSATLVVRMTLPDLVQRSAVVIEGQCLSTRTIRDARGVIVTEVTVAVDRGRKGSRDGERFVFRMPGGELAGRTLVVPGMPRFSSGDEVFLFLTEPSGRGWRMPVGLAQGVFRVQRDPATGARRLARDLTGLELVDAKTGQAVSAPARSVEAYDQLVAQVDALLEADR